MIQSLLAELQPKRLLQWIVLLVLSGMAALLADRFQVPAEWMFGPLIVSLIWALIGRHHVRVPPVLYVLAQTLIGLHLSARFNLSTLHAVQTGWWMISLVTLATLVFSVALGLLFAQFTRLGVSTAAMGLIAGGSAGIVATSDSVGADARLVTYMQYLRLVLVVVSTPLLVKAMGGLAHAVGAIDPEVGGIGTGVLAWDVLLAGGIVAIGTWVGLRFKFPGGALIVPLLLGILATSVLHLRGVWLPEAATEAAFAVVGLYIGLQFDRTTVGQMWRFTPMLIGFVAVLVVGCALLGLLLSRVTGIDRLTGYLATTPGGINAVTITALSVGVNTTLVVAVQTVRLLVTLLLGPPLVQWWVNRGTGAVLAQTGRPE